MAEQNQNLLAERIQQWLVRFMLAIRGKRILGLKEAHTIRTRAAGKFAKGEKPSQFAIIAIAADVLNVPVRINEEGSLAIRVANHTIAKANNTHMALEEMNRKQILELNREIENSKRQTEFDVSIQDRVKSFAKEDMDFFNI